MKTLSRKRPALLTVGVVLIGLSLACLLWVGQKQWQHTLKWVRIITIVLFLAVSVCTYANPEPVQKMKVGLGVLQAKLLKFDSRRAYIYFSAVGHQWKRDITLAVLVKEGKRVSSSSFRLGDLVLPKGNT